MNRRLARTINLGNALEAPQEGDWGLVLKPEYFRLVKDAGFTAVRIPIRWSAHAPTSRPYTIDPELFTRVDWAVNQGLSNGLAVVIDFSHYKEIMSDPSSHEERFLALWRQISQHYEHYPDDLMFDLLGEPHNQLDPKVWNNVIAAALHVVRSSDSTRTIVVESADYARLHALKNLELPTDDRHIIVSIHYYDPMRFTHQGAVWVSGSDAWLGTAWNASRDEKQSVLRDFDLIARWGLENERPIFLGEFGAIDKADSESRALWTGYVAREAERHGFGWGYWSFAGPFGIYDPIHHQWDDSLLRALMPHS